MAGTTWVARHFPVRIGRAPSSDLQSQEEGVWNEHVTIEFKPAEGFLLQPYPQALCSVNGQPVERTLLRNGDVLELGALRLQFWLAETRQSSLGFEEGVIWAGIAGICLGQIALIYWLLKS